MYTCKLYRFGILSLQYTLFIYWILYSILSNIKSVHSILSIFSIPRGNSLAAAWVCKRPVIVCEKYWKHLKISRDWQGSWVEDDREDVDDVGDVGDGGDGGYADADAEETWSDVSLAVGDLSPAWGSGTSSPSCSSFNAFNRLGGPYD